MGRTSGTDPEGREGPGRGGDRATQAMTAHSIPAALAGSNGARALPRRSDSVSLQPERSASSRTVSTRLVGADGPPEHRPDTAISIRRLAGRVLVSVQGRVTRDLAAVLRHAVIDLVDGQGNLSLALDLPDEAVRDDEVLALLMETARRLEERNGALLVRDVDGRWLPPVPSPAVRPQPTGSGRRDVADEATAR